MKKYIFTYYINVLGLIVAIYLDFLIMSLCYLINGERIYLSLIFEIISSSLMFFLGAIVYNILPLCTFVIIMLVFDYILLYKYRNKIVGVFVTEIIIYTTIYLVYALTHHLSNFILIPLVFIITQWKRLNILKHS